MRFVYKPFLQILSEKWSGGESLYWMRPVSAIRIDQFSWKSSFFDLWALKLFDCHQFACKSIHCYLRFVNHNLWASKFDFYQKLWFAIFVNRTSFIQRRLTRKDLAWNLTSASIGATERNSKPEWWRLHRRGLQAANIVWLKSDSQNLSDRISDLEKRHRPLKG